MVKRVHKPLAVFLLGPTGSGKTELACRLYERHNFDLISVDSAQVYRGMDLGTAKPDAATLARIPHRLIDIRDPADTYSAADFCADAALAMANANAAGRTPLLVGGTMLYFKVLLDPLAPMPKVDTAVRADLQAQLAAGERQMLSTELAAVDPEAHARIASGDSQRLVRALEVHRSSGVSLSQWQRRGRHLRTVADDYQILQFGLLPEDRAGLYRRLATRFDAMLRVGLVEEVARLHERSDLSSRTPAMRAVGYRQVWQYLAGECSYEAMVERARAASRQLAKRQYVWLRNWPNLVPLSQTPGQAEQEILEQISQCAAWSYNRHGLPQ